MSRTFESCLKSLPHGCTNCVLAGECAELQLYLKGKKDAIEEYKQTDEYIKECVQRYLKGKADGKAEAIDKCINIFKSIPRHYYRDELLNELEQMKENK